MRPRWPTNLMNQGCEIHGDACISVHLLVNPLPRTIAQYSRGCQHSIYIGPVKANPARCKTVIVEMVPQTDRCLQLHHMRSEREQMGMRGRWCVRARDDDESRNMERARWR